VREEGGGIRICFWNTAGLMNKCEETWMYLEKFDIIGLVETWMEEETWEKTRDKMSCVDLHADDKKTQERKSKRRHYYSGEQKIKEDRNQKIKQCSARE